ncbi:MAG: amidohydrolase family protein [Vicinamibacteria bacterium]|nr:amidohydrolase family protein [Vicinamibacteria bacterium]
MAARRPGPAPGQPAGDTPAGVDATGRVQPRGIRQTRGGQSKLRCADHPRIRGDETGRVRWPPGRGQPAPVAQDVVFGSDRVMFGTDWPHQVHDTTGAFANTARLPKTDCDAVRSANAQRVFRL